MESQNENSENQYNFSNWTATASGIVISWLAFRELLSQGSIVVGVGPSQIVMNLFNRGWSRRVLGVDLPLKDSQIIDRMSGTPHDFCVAYDAGVDILGSPSYHCIMPWRLPELIKNFQPGEPAISSALSQFESGKVKAAQEVAEREAAKNNSVRSTIKLSPFLFTNPVKKFFTRYGIDGERVYVRKSLGGLFTFNRGASHPVGLIRDVRPEGNWIVGKVVFRDDTTDVVVWDRVFLPRRKARYAKTVVEEYRMPQNSSEQQSSARHERTCPFCAELILVEAKRCKHCHSNLDS